MILKAASGFSDEETQMIRLKYSAKKICELSESELYLQVKKMLLQMYVITGWAIPSGDIKKILEDQFQKKLLENYSLLNTDEIIYAFRQTGTEIEDWGKEMNLNLVDKVLKPYLVTRQEISQKEERKVPPPPQKIYTDEEILNQRRAEIELAFQAMKRGKMPLIHRYFSEVLKEDGFIKEENEMSDFFVKSIGMSTEHLYENDSRP